MNIYNDETYRIEVRIKHDKDGTAHAEYGGQTFSVAWETEIADFDGPLGSALGLHWQTANDVADAILNLGPGETKYISVVDYRLVPGFF